MNKSKPRVALKEMKTVFHGSYADEKPVVTLSFCVNNSNRLSECDITNVMSLINEIESFQRRLGWIKDELIDSLK